MSPKRYAAAAIVASLALAACGGDDDDEPAAEEPAEEPAPEEPAEEPMEEPAEEPMEEPAEEPAPEELAEEPAESLSGSVVVSGSSTVEPISIAVAEKFSAANPDVNIAVDGPGTGDGFVLFCQGETDINDASSKVKPEQEEDCAANGVEFIELQVGNDGISMMTNT
ncbi:MAG: substrate-binding domain-containing protein, partial [Acidimicrobiia bacterium]